MLFGYIESQPLNTAGFFIFYLLDYQYMNGLFLDASVIPHLNLAFSVLDCDQLF